MAGNSAVNSIFEDFQKTLSKEQEVRESIRSICKEIDQISREITTTLQVIHHSEDEVTAACQRSRDLLKQTNQWFVKLKEIVPANEYYRYHDHWRNQMQRYSFLISLIIWLEKGIMAEHETVAAILGVSHEEEKAGFHMDIEDYLVGLLWLCSELSRLAVNAVTRSDYHKPLQISKFVMEMNAGFRLLNLKNDQLRKRFDALKYDVKKIEEVVYDLSIRGLLPKVGEVEVK